MKMSNNASPGGGAKWATLAYHRRWLLKQADALFDFFAPHSMDPAGGFVALDETGQPVARTGSGQPRSYEIHATTRMVHCFAIARLMGRPGAWAFVDHGMNF